MFNVKVVRLKDIGKYIIYVLVSISIIYILNKSVLEEKIGKKVTLNIIEKIDIQSVVESVMPLASILEKKTADKIVLDIEKILEAIFKSEVLIAKVDNTENVVESRENELNEEIEVTIEENEEEIIEEVEVKEVRTDVETKVVTPNPIQESYNFTYGDVKIKNGTSYKLTEKMLEPNLEITNSDMIIFNTHSCESYTPSEKYKYEQTGNFRSTETKYNVTGVAKELSNILTNYGYNAIQNATYHDYPSYSGSYSRSLTTVENQLKSTPVDIVFDIHRDAIGSISDYAPSVQIGDEVAAQLMFVIGTNNGGLAHDTWEENLKFAILVQQKAEEMYPGLFKPIYLTESRYNQHIANYASIIEVGATGNTMDQALVSMKYLAKVLDEVLKENI